MDPWVTPATAPVPVTDPSALWPRRVATLEAEVETLHVETNAVHRELQETRAAHTAFHHSLVSTLEGLTQSIDSLAVAAHRLQQRLGLLEDSVIRVQSTLPLHAAQHTALREIVLNTILERDTRPM